MIVTCPNCKTTYNLPDGKAAPGARLRCTVCKHIFVLEEPKPPLPLDDIGLNLDDTSPKRKKKAAKADKTGKKKGRGLLVFLVLLVLLGGGTAGAWFFTPLLDPIKPMILGAGTSTPAAQSGEDLAALVGKLTFNAIRQYEVTNDKIGKLTVIEGKVVNGFTEPRDLITLEATIFDNDKKPLISKTQLAGTFVSLFQLQVLTEKELEQALSNKLDILSNNTNVAPGAQVPFMIVLFNPPDTATDFTIKPVSAKKSQPQK